MKRLLLILIVLAGIILLSGCCYWVCDGFVIPPQSKCSLIVVANSWEVYGWIVIDGNPTGKYIYPYQSITIYDVLCYEIATVSIVDNYGYWLHEEDVYITPGTNYAYFNY